MENIRNSVDFVLAEKKLSDIIMSDGLKKYKIGKTGQLLKDRFDSKYKEEYDEIIPLCTSPSKEFINSLEEHFTERLMSSSMCCNEQIGSGEMTNESGNYSLYVVIKR